MVVTINNNSNNNIKSNVNLQTAKVDSNAKIFNKTAKNITEHIFIAMLSIG